MKLKNKKTGEIIEACELNIDEPSVKVMGIDSVNRKNSYHSLAKLNEEWEDYEEPKEEPTVYGFDMKDIEMARMLLAEGITPRDLKEHYHDFEWVASILKKDLEKQMKNAVQYVKEKK